MEVVGVGGEGEEEGVSVVVVAVVEVATSADMVQRLHGRERDGSRRGGRQRKELAQRQQPREEMNGCEMVVMTVEVDVKRATWSSSLSCSAVTLCVVSSPVTPVGVGL